MATLFCDPCAREQVSDTLHSLFLSEVAIKGKLSLQATGKVHTLWTAFARFYERHGDLDNARVIFEKATQACCSPKRSRASLCSLCFE